MHTARLLLPRIMAAEDAHERLANMFAAHYELVWRSLRRLGTPPEAIDDAVQEVFVIASRRLSSIIVGKEKAFLFGTAVRIAAAARRTAARRADELDDAVDSTLPPTDELVDRKRVRELLDLIIAKLPDDTRPVFVLYELEGMTMAEIASCLDLRPGTVASRLRRGREVFAATVARLEARRTHG